jgi:hypothetical protein
MDFRGSRAREANSNPRRQIDLTANFQLPNQQIHLAKTQNLAPSTTKMKSI